MAAVDLPPVQNDYVYAEQELQNHILRVYGTSNNADDDMFRPALADSQKIGFFSLDRNSQTEVTEIVDLKEMTKVLQILLQDVANLRRDINFTKHVMQADHEAKLQQKSLELYCRINERVSELEKIHQDRVNALRKAFRQQLADAIARLSVMYKKNLDTSIKRERTRQQSDLKGQDNRILEMKSTITHQESIISMLKLQLQQQQQAKHEERQFFIEDSPIGSGTPQSMSRFQALQDEMEEMRAENEKLEKQTQRLSEALDIKDEQTGQFQAQIESLQKHLEKEQILVEQLKHETEEIRSEAEKNIQQSKKLLMKQKLEMEHMTSEQLRLAKEEAINAARSEAAKLSAVDHGKLKELMDQKKELEKQLAVERSKSSDRSAKGDTENSSLKQSEERLRNEIRKLKEEIERVHRTWEKKFSILQASMHALKDESYMRQQLQRQAATLHHASVSYAADIPVGATPSKQNTPQKKPLPDIRRSGRSGRGANDRDYISYTVSAPSGRATAVMSVDENQVISDNEQDLPSDVMPIPEPPHRTAQDCGAEDNSRPSTRSHIVMLPQTSV